MINPLICLIFGYLIGSLNFAIVYSKLRGDDIRRHGSGNAGATNVLRVYGKGSAALVFTLDILKGVFAVILARLIFRSEAAQCAAAFGAVLGHNFPVYYGFSGGKGVATSFATLLALDARVALCALAVFALVLIISRYVSLSSIAASAAVIIFSFVFDRKLDEFTIMCTVMGALCIIRHHSNISRLIHGTENKLGHKSA